MRRAIFLDRDGVVNAALFNPVENTLDSPYCLEDFRLLPGVPTAIRDFNRMGFITVVVSNQPGVAKGKCSHKFLETINSTLQQQLAESDARLDAIYYCLHHPAAVVEALRLQCDCRKPKPGLLFLAARELEIDLCQSYMVGDSATDVAAGLAAGCRTIFLQGHRPAAAPSTAPAEAHLIERDLLSAAWRLQIEEN